MINDVPGRNGELGQNQESKQARKKERKTDSMFLPYFFVCMIAMFCLFVCLLVWMYKYV